MLFPVALGEQSEAVDINISSSLKNEGERSHARKPGYKTKRT